ncbi:unnamed protein product [Durusdinium trenchii]|uniref:Uncharacterized protein n=1 Tax=Durusdinium trenchii TaxID=1381693 RepID=A0ABP0Q0F8_9DINO
MVFVMAAAPEVPALPPQAIQLSVLMLLGSSFCGLGTLAYASGFRCQRPVDENAFYFVGGLFIGFVLLEILAARRLAGAHVVQGPEHTYVR